MREEEIREEIVGKIERTYEDCIGVWGMPLSRRPDSAGDLPSYEAETEEFALRVAHECDEPVILCTQDGTEYVDSDCVEAKLDLECAEPLGSSEIRKLLDEKNDLLGRGILPGLSLEALDGECPVVGKWGGHPIYEFSDARLLSLSIPLTSVDELLKRLFKARERTLERIGKLTRLEWSPAWDTGSCVLSRATAGGFVADLEVPYRHTDETYTVCVRFGRTVRAEAMTELLEIMGPWWISHGLADDLGAFVDGEKVPAYIGGTAGPPGAEGRRAPEGRETRVSVSSYRVFDDPPYRWGAGQLSSEDLLQAVARFIDAALELASGP